MKTPQTVYKDCLMQVYTSAGALNNARCDIRFDGKAMIISYMGYERNLWHCSERAPGHYECKREGDSFGIATLHQFQAKRILEGSLKYQDGATMVDGMWRITLGAPWRGPKSVKKGDYILIQDGATDKWVKCKVIAVIKEHVKTKEYTDLPFSSFEESWKLPEGN